MPLDLNRFAVLLATGFAVTGCAGGPGGGDATSCGVSAGPEVQISHEEERTGERPAYMFELQLAINPTNPKNFVASGIHVRGAAKDDPDQRHQEVLAYRSDDAGATWQQTALPPFPKVDGKDPFAGDPTTVFSKSGTAIYMTYTRPNSAHLSTDGGRTWTDPIKMTDDGLDHWMVAGDYTDGPHAGNVYAYGMGIKRLKERTKPNEPVDYNFIEYQMRVLRTQDDGKTWTDQLVTTTTELGIPGNGLNSVSDILVAKDGKLYLPFHSWNNVDRKKPQGQWMVTSNDGGNTFSKAERLKKADGTLLTGEQAGSYPGFALDVTDGPFKDRLYIVWVDSTAATARWQMLFSFSDDGGKSFAEPKVMQDSLIPMDQNHPDLSVNHRGVLVVTWYRFAAEGPDSAMAGGLKQQGLVYNRYVTASLDGGQTFLPEKQLASVMSRSPGVYSPQYGWSMRYVRFGDYFNVAPDPDGTFHTIWMGGASGPTQMWYAPIRVTCGDEPATARKRR